MGANYRSQVTGEEHMTIAWYDPTNHHVSTDKNDSSFTPLGQLWPLDVKREWVGLTFDEKQHALYISDWETSYMEAVIEYIEAKLKKRNA